MSVGIAFFGVAVTVDLCDGLSCHGVVEGEVVIDVCVGCCAPVCLCPVGGSVDVFAVCGGEGGVSDGADSVGEYFVGYSAVGDEEVVVCNGEEEVGDESGAESFEVAFVYSVGGEFVDGFAGGDVGFVVGSVEDFAEVFSWFPSRRITLSRGSATVSYTPRGSEPRSKRSPTKM